MQVKYTYDNLNQLIREDNKERGVTIVYTYDANGNMTRREEYDFNTGTLSGNPKWIDDYNYDSTWKDQLNNFNGTSITYDAIGNPLRYRDNMIFSWKNGRQAAGITTIDRGLSFKYDRNGMRVQKTVKFLGFNISVDHTYDYAGGTLIRESYGDTELWFMYDESGSPVGFCRQVGTISTPYYYVKNLQGDIVAIARGGDGAILARYTYDAWGNILSITDDNGNDISGKPNEIANINPLRYRGYYYDTETELYYLKSRFYDPATGRFVNADGFVSTGTGLLGTNMYAYCGNNSINYYDPNGNCYYGANGVWTHDQWEYIGNYERKPEPTLLDVQQTSTGRVYIVPNGTESFSVPRGSSIVYDKRDETTPSNNNFEVYESHNITEKPVQREICKVIVDYNNSNPGNYNWNRNIISMLNEWEWHNQFYEDGFRKESARSVNFDMGLGSNSLNKGTQQLGYFIE